MSVCSDYNGMKLEINKITCLEKSQIFGNYQLTSKYPGVKQFNIIFLQKKIKLKPNCDTISQTLEWLKIK